MRRRSARTPPSPLLGGARLLLALAAGLAAAACASAPGPLVGPSPPGAPPPEGPTAGAAGPAVPVHGRFEATFVVPDWTGLPDDLLVEAGFEDPSGRVWARPGFAAGSSRDGGWAVRFTPVRPGAHRWEARADLDADGRAEARVAGGSFVAVGAGGRGFVRRDPGWAHGLAYEDGTPFFVLGENRINIYDPSWNWQGLGIAEYVAAMAQSGMTTVRVFVFTDCEGEDLPGGVQLGCLEPEVGRFDEAQAARYDELFDAAEAHGVQVILCPFALGFTEGETWKSWEDNPYNAALGGPAARPVDFFTEPAARDAAARRLRYVAARWGASPSLLAIDLLNEPEWDGPIGEETWTPWAEDLAARWDALDAYDHLITVGPVGLHWNVAGDERAWYASRWNDIVQWHLYGEPYYEVHALAAELVRKVAETWTYDRPVLNGEFGYGGEDPATWDHTHVGIWATSFAGAGVLSHSAPPFNLDSDAPMTPERRAHFRTLSGVLHDLARAGVRRPLGPQPAEPAGTLALALDGEGGRAVWVLAPLEGYGQPARDVTVTLEGLAEGGWTARFLDDVTGETLAERTFGVAAGAAEVRLAFPPFVRHAVALLTRR